MSAFCCFKSSPQVDNTTKSSKSAKASIRKDRSELDLLAQQRQMGRDTDLGLGNMGMGMGLSFEDTLDPAWQADKKQAML